MRNEKTQACLYRSYCSGCYCSMYTRIDPDNYQYLVCKHFSITLMVRESCHHCDLHLYEFNLSILKFVKWACKMHQFFFHEQICYNLINGKQDIQSSTYCNTGTQNIFKYSQTQNYQMIHSCKRFHPAFYHCCYNHCAQSCSCTTDFSLEE